MIPLKSRIASILSTWRNLTRAELCDIIGCTSKRLRQYESGKLWPSARELANIEMLEAKEKEE